MKWMAWHQAVREAAAHSELVGMGVMVEGGE